MARSYASLAELRAEGVTVAQANDARCQAALEQATTQIDELCGWWFDAQALTLTFSGRGRTRVRLPAPVISLASVTVDGSTLALTDVEPTCLAPFMPGDAVDDSELMRTQNVDLPYSYWPLGRRMITDEPQAYRPVWPVGYRNIVVVGTFGRTEYDTAVANGHVPLAIKRACMMIAISQLAPLAEYDTIRDSLGAAGRIKSMKTSTQTVEFHAPTAAAGGSVMTGDPDIDAILARYRRPFAIGSV